MANLYTGTGLGRPLRFLLPFFRAKEGNRLLCEELTLIPKLAKAVKAASVIRPNRNLESCGVLRQTALVCIPSLPTFCHGGNDALGFPLLWLP
jgi:hypothetical protein